MQYYNDLSKKKGIIMYIIIPLIKFNKSHRKPNNNVLYFVCYNFQVHTHATKQKWFRGVFPEASEKSTKSS